MVFELLKAFSLIFIAEMGDKTQILAMAFASKYKVKQVLIGVFIGSLLNHALAVVLGSNLQHIIPLSSLSIIAGFSFILFGLWNLKVDTDEEDNKVSKYGPIITVSIAFFVGELGDKTQLTAIVLSADANFPILILVGTVLGMVFTSMIGIIIGRKLGNRIDEFYIKMAASFVFLLFGYIKLFESLPVQYVNLLYMGSFSIVVFVIASFMLIPTIQQRKDQLLTKYQKTASALFHYYNEIEEDIKDICLGEGTCGLCEGNRCPIGYTKNLLKASIEASEVKQSYQVLLKSDKDFDVIKVRESLWKTIKVLEKDWNNKEFSEVHVIRRNLETILIGDNIEGKTFLEYYFKLIKLDSSFEELKDVDKN